MTVENNECGAAFRLPKDLERLFDAIDVVRIADSQDIPSIRDESRLNVFGERDARVAWLEPVCTEVNNVMTRGRGAVAKVLFQSKPAVIGGDSNAHVLSLIIWSRNNLASLQINRVLSSHFCLRFLNNLVRGSAIRQNQGMIPANAAGWNGNVSGLQARKHSRFFASGY
jgi:hypothetical protein